MSNETDPATTFAELSALIEQLEQEPNAELRERALYAIQLVTEFYGEGLRAVMRALESAPQGHELTARLLESEVVRALLLIHGLMPVEVYDRTAAALESMREYFLSQGCQIELLGINDARAKVRLIRNGQQPAPIEFLKNEIEKALAAAAPELAGVEIEGFAQQIEATLQSAAALGRMIDKSRQPATQPLVQIRRGVSASPLSHGTWIPCIRAHGLSDGQFKIVKFKDVEVLICRIGGEFYAYRNSCAADKRPLDDALYELPMITCSCHGYRYDLRRGSCMEKPELKLESLPVMIEEERVKVAIST